jgi:eukaryotic-like serine/threonine-protein kinase
VIAAARTLLGKPTPCVGRERELALLDGVFAECVENPSAHAVLITAAAGAGKSRVAQEFLRRRKAEGAELEVWTGRGDPCSVGSSFAILAQAVRRTCGILDGEPLVVRLKKLRARVALNVPAGDRQRVADFLGEMIGCETVDASDMLRAARQSNSLMHDQMRRAWEDFVAAECAARPLVIVLEDLQWGDPATIKFTSAALRRAAELPLMVLAIARPEVTTLFPGLFAGKQSTSLQLGDLTARAGEKLIRAVLGNVDAGVVARLVERAGGNAFYLEELIRAVAEGKGDALPETVLAMLQARIDALDAPTRRTLRAASVFGQQFWAGGIEALLGEHAGEGLAALDELADRELIEPRGDGRFPGEPEYTFRHAIIRDAAYSLLTEQDRVLGHRLAGEWLERHGEHDAIALADHFAAGGERPRAASWYAAAADEALAANDFDAAVARAERGLGGAEGELAGRLHGIQLEAELWRGNLARAAQCGEAALRLLPPGAPAWYGAVAVMARVCASLGRRDDVVALSRGLLARPADLEHDHAILAWGNVALRLGFLCEYALEDELLAPLAQATRSPSVNHNVRAAVLEGFAHKSQVDGDLVAALEQTLEAVASYRAAGNLRDAYYAQIGVAIVQNELGAFDAAEATLRELTVAAAAAAIPTVATVARYNLGLTLAYLGKFADAEAIEREAFAELIAAGDRRLGTSAQSYLMRILAAAGRGAEAAALGDGGAPGLGTTGSDLLWIGAYALALLAAGRVAEALPVALQARRRLEEIGTIEEGESVIRLVHVEALLAAGESDQARAALVEAHTRVRERASRLADPAWRASFLERVPENARLLVLAREHGLM